jgi:hypothetical protein
VHAYWIAFWVITGLLLVFLLGILVSLKNSPDWSLAGALAEKSVATRTVTKRDEQPRAAEPNKGTEQQTAAVRIEATPELVLGSSASRLIATLGTLVLTTIMLGVGYAMIWSLFTRGQIPALDGIGPFLLGGAALFAPYAFNQLKEAFKPVQRQ